MKIFPLVLPLGMALGRVSGKVRAAKAFFTFYRFLLNWRQVWDCYRNSRPLPPFRFRRGFSLYHAAGDDPVMLLNEIFAKRIYSRHLDGMPASVFVDIGAHIGTTTLDFLSRSPGLEVHAYEANLPTFQTLQKNISENGFSSRVQLHQEAVGGQKGNIEFYSQLPSPLTSEGCRLSGRYLGGDAGDVAMMQAYDAAARSSQGRTTLVPVIELEVVFARIKTQDIDLVKIDAEGAEVGILEKSQPNVLRQTRHFALEYHNHIVPNALARCVQALKAAGFDCTSEGSAVKAGTLYAARQ